MKVFWWQGGLHIQPESHKEAEALVAVVDSLNLVDVDESPTTGPISGHLANQNSVSRMHVRG